MELYEKPETPGTRSDPGRDRAHAIRSSADMKAPGATRAFVRAARAGVELVPNRLRLFQLPPQFSQIPAVDRGPSRRRCYRLLERLHCSPSVMNSQKRSGQLSPDVYKKSESFEKIARLDLPGRTYPRFPRP